MLYVQDPFFLRRPCRQLMPLCLLIMVLMVSVEITEARLASVYDSSRCVSLDGLSMPCICHPVHIALGNANRFKIHGPAERRISQQGTALSHWLKFSLTKTVDSV
jgi:hypothetical protein